MKTKTRKSKALKETAESKPEAESVQVKPKKTKKKKEAQASDPLIENESEKTGSSIRLYTLKFSTPILPFAKFPLTQNKYI